MEKFSSIEALRHVVVSVRKYFDARGQHYPTIKFKGTVKLHGCFANDTLITMSDGTYKTIDSIKVNDVVQSYDINNQAYTNSRVLNTFSRSLNKEWVKLHFSNGHTIECTADHRFYTKNRGWVEAQNLTSDDEYIMR